MSIQTKIFLSILLSFLVLVMGSTVFGQTYDLAPVAKQQFLDANGDPLSSGKIYTYIAGTTTNQATYSDNGGTANANPIVLDSGGFANIWLDASLNYKFKVTSSADVTQYTIDNINSVFSARTITVGDGTANDARLIFDGNETDFTLGLDDSLNTAQLVDESTLGSNILTEWEQISTGTSGQRVKFYGNNPGTAADNDETYNSHLLENDAGAQVEVARMTWVALDVSATDDDSEIQLDTFVNNTFQQVLSIGSASATSADVELTLNNGTAADTIIKFDGNATDFGFGLDDSTDDICLSDEEALGTDNLVCFPEVGTGTSVQRMQIYGANTGTPADNDESYQSFFTENDANNQVEIGRISWKALDVSAADDDSQFTFDTFVNNSLTEVLKVGSRSSTDAVGVVDVTGDLDVSVNLTVSGTGAMADTLTLSGSTPTFNLGDDGAEDIRFVYLGNAVDFYSCLDDTEDDLVIGLGSTCGTNPAITITGDGTEDVLFSNDVRVNLNLRVGAAGTNDAPLHVLNAATNDEIATFEAIASTSAQGIEIHYDGAISHQFRAQAGAAQINIAERDLGNDAIGPRFYMNRNNNSTQATASAIGLTDKGNQRYLIWPDDSGDLRIGTTEPIGSQDTSGTIVGTQTSPEAIKNILFTYPNIPGDLAYEKFQAVINTEIKEFNFRSGRLNQNFTGLAIPDGEHPWYGQDPVVTDLETDIAPIGTAKSLNELNMAGYFILSFKVLNKRIEELENEIENLTRRGRVIAGTQ